MIDMCNKVEDRVPAIDMAKGIGILCVFIGHLTYWGTPVSKLVFSFHLSLFFFISGWLFSIGKYTNLQQILSKVVKSFFVPYIFFAIMGCFVLPFREDITLRDLGSIINSIIYSGHPKVNGPLWFFVSLAGVELAYWFWHRSMPSLLRRNDVLVGFSLASTFIVVYMLHCCPGMRQFVPLKLETLPIGLFFFSAGRLAWRKVDWLIQAPHSNSKSIMMSILSFLGLLSCLPFAKPSCLQGAQIRDVMFLPMSFLGIVAVLMASRSLACSSNGMWKWIMYIGRNSLLYFSLEFVTLPVLLWIGHGIDKRIEFYPLNHRIPLSYSLILLLLQFALISIIASPVSKMLTNFQKVCTGKE